MQRHRRKTSKSLVISRLGIMFIKSSRIFPYKFIIEDYDKNVHHFNVKTLSKFILKILISIFLSQESENAFLCVINSCQRFEHMILLIEKTLKNYHRSISYIMYFSLKMC